MNVLLNDDNLFSPTGYLYKNNKLLLIGCWEDLVDFVEELKELNPKYINRKEFKVLDADNYLMKEWKRK